MSELSLIAKKMVARGKGILAADESDPTCQKRFDGVGIECTAEKRRDYRAMLFTAPNLADSISGVILFDETIRQSTADGKNLGELLSDNEILVGIKVDRGAKDLALHPGEKITEGLDGLRERLAEYRAMGARFAKWRAVITIGDNIPSDYCVEANMHALARYAALCQEQDIVPILEPETLMDGDHSIDRCRDATTAALKGLYSELEKHKVNLPETILKVNMVLPGKGCPQQNTDEEIAEATLEVFVECVPAAVPGIVFLSGGQTPDDACRRLDVINKMAANNPWVISFSYGRGLQDKALAAWSRDTSDNGPAQEQLIKYCALNGQASMGAL